MKGLLIFFIAIIWGSIIVSAFFLASFYISNNQCRTKESPKCPQIMCGNGNAADGQACGDNKSSCFAQKKTDDGIAYNYAPDSTF